MKKVSDDLKKGGENPSLSPRSNRPRGSFSRFLAAVLILSGIGLMGFALISRLHADDEKNRLIAQYQALFSEEESAPPEETAAPEEEGDEPTKSDLLGLLTIPKIDLTVVIGEGVENSVLKYAVGHFTGTALPGEEGNCCLVGHRNYTWGEFFNRLDELEPGDEILIERGKASYRYVVTETFIVEPTELSVLDQGEGSTITLITCTPIRVASHRLIVKGRLTE